MRRNLPFATGIALFCLLLAANTGLAQGTAFTYQGQLLNAGAPAGGTYNLTFTLFNTNMGGAAVAPPLTNNAVNVTNGLFTVIVDFGAGPWNGQTNWLEIGVETNGTGSFTTLAPRQQLTPAPYAIFAGNAAMLSSGVAVGTAAGNVISSSGAYDSFIGGGVFNNIQPNSLDSFIGGGFGNTNYANAGFSMIAGGENNSAASGWSVIGGGFGNAIFSGWVSSTIGGGSQNAINNSYATAAGGWSNSANAFASTVSGGFLNTAGGNYGFVGGGYGNTVATNTSVAVMAGGYNNTNNSTGGVLVGGYGNNIQTNSDYSFIGGGELNTASALVSFIGGGQNHLIAPGSYNSTIGGGSANVILSNSFYSTISGGNGNSILPNSQWSSLGGGWSNTNGGQYSTVPGGAQNYALGARSFAAGWQAQALSTGDFVWADAQGVPFASTTANQFSVRAGGGVRFVTSGAGMTLDGQTVLAGSVGSNQLTGAYVGAVIFNNPADSFTGSFTGNGGALTNLNAWALNGNKGTSAGVNFVGTTDNQPLEIHVNGRRASRFEPTADDVNHTNLVNVVNGSGVNFVSAGVHGATISGGGAAFFSGAASTNIVVGDLGTVGGGAGNLVGLGSTVSGGIDNICSNLYATVGGGAQNTSSGFEATIGGGVLNTASATAATVAGGRANSSTGMGAFVGGGGYDGTNAVGNQSSGAASVVAGGLGNVASGIYATDVGGVSNIVNGVGSFIGGGGCDGFLARGNNIQDNAATICGGFQNSIPLNGTYAFIGGGSHNTAAYLWTTIGGGQLNTANNTLSTVSGGYGNTASGPGAFVGGGGYDGILNAGNVASGAASVVAGGLTNVASNTYSTIGGGQLNAAGGIDATVPGGALNVAGGPYSLAAGQQAQALHQGAFVWADSQNAAFASTGNNQFLIRAQGGVGINLSNPTDAALSVGGRVRMNDNNIYFRSGTDVNHGLGFFGSGSPNGLFAGTNVNGPVLWGNGGGGLGIVNGSQALSLYWTAAGVTVYGTFNNLSDRNAKENFTAVSSKDVLDKVAALPISEWSYITDAATRHIGPVAQDFYAAFNVGTDDKHIAPIDEGGVALAAIQGLNRKLDEKNAEIQQLKERLERLEKIIERQN